MSKKITVREFKARLKALLDEALLTDASGRASIDSFILAIEEAPEEWLEENLEYVGPPGGSSFWRRKQLDA